jgi:hypothetical protein
MLLVVTDGEGRIVATAPPPVPSKKEPTASLASLPGQMLHQVPIPAELERKLTESLEGLHEALAEYELRAGPALSLLIPRTRRSGAHEST